MSEHRKKIYSVWVGGGEANDYYLNWIEASQLALSYIGNGYDDAIIENIETDENFQFVGGEWKYLFTSGQWRES